MILQTILDEDKRGRVMSLFTITFMGGWCLADGFLARWIGPRCTLLIGGGGCLVGTVIFIRQLPLIREKIRPISEAWG